MVNVPLDAKYKEEREEVKRMKGGYTKIQDSFTL